MRQHKPALLIKNYVFGTAKLMNAMKKRTPKLFENVKLLNSLPLEVLDPIGSDEIF